MSKDIYKEDIKIAVQTNMKEVKELLLKKDKDLLKKIEDFAEKYLIEEEYIKEKILVKESISLAMFSKEPTKQNIFEKIASGFISKIEGVKNFQKLPNTSHYVCNGVVIKKEDLKQYPKAKTIDFTWKFSKFTIYCSHKYTKDSGGAQDNQYKDLQGFIEECRDNKKTDVVFIAIADGEYYQMQNGRAGMKKIDNLRQMCTSSVKVCDICELEQVLNNLK